MATLPAGMTDATFQYVLKFTIEHEGDTPFMYNNWSAKNAKRDVTIGVGRALPSLPMIALGPGQFTCAAGEREAAAVRSMFRVKATGGQPSADQMIAEYRRVYNTERIGGNLFSAYQTPSPLEMDREAMLRDLQAKMLKFWDDRSVEQHPLPELSTIPAQAQVALMSWNYGLRLRGAPKMCDAVRAGNYVLAANETFVPGVDAQKNAAHKQLMLNAARIVAAGMDPNTLPPMTGPFKPPPAVPGAQTAGATTSNTLNPTQLAGTWRVAIGHWKGLFFFDSKGGVSWAESGTSRKHAGKWFLKNGRLEWKFLDPGDFRIFTVPLAAVSTAEANGTILPAGQGSFRMSKASAQIA